jgi:hypothetical protein
VLGHIGWILQSKTWEDRTGDNAAIEMNQRILEVLPVAFAGGAAVAVLTAGINALKKMGGNSPWITLFRREALKQKIERFQIGSVEATGDAKLSVSLLQCLFEAKKTITQVLFWKFTDVGASFRARAVEAGINRRVMLQMKPTIQNRISAYQAEYLSSIVDLPGAP